MKVIWSWRCKMVLEPDEIERAFALVNPPTTPIAGRFRPATIRLHWEHRHQIETIEAAE
jgi:hypothetical protein